MSDLDNFDSPIYDQQSNDGPIDRVIANKAQGGGSSSSSGDLNDLSLLSESLDTNAHLDAFAGPPPIPDAIYQAKLQHIDNKDGRAFTIKQGKTGPYLYTQQRATILDSTGKLDGRQLTDYYLPTTPDRNGAIPMVAVLAAMGVRIPGKANQKEIWEMYLKAIKGEPIIRIETAWEANLPQEISDLYKADDVKARKVYAPRVIGMRKFPQNPDGSYQTETKVDCSNIGKGMQTATAQARIVRYYALK